MEFLNKKMITTSVHYIPIHKQPYYKKYNFLLDSFKNSNFYYDSAISLPIFPYLTKEKQNYIIKCIEKFFQK